MIGIGEVPLPSIDMFIYFLKLRVLLQYSSNAR